MEKNKNYKGKKRVAKNTATTSARIEMKVFTPPSVFTLKIGKTTHKLSESEARKLRSDLDRALDDDDRCLFEDF